MTEQTEGFMTPVQTIPEAPVTPVQGIEDPISSFPTEQIELPSKGWFYAPDSPLSKGVLDLHYMTAKHEDILTSRTLIQRGIVIDRLIQALIATPGVKYDDLLLGDKDAITIAARILGYGKDYDVKIECPSCGKTIDTTANLQELENKESPLIGRGSRGINDFEYKLPVSGDVVTFKLLNVRDEKMVDLELERMKKINRGGVTSEVTTRMRHAITSFNGSRDPAEIKEAIDRMLSRDSLEFRGHVRSMSPDIDMSFQFACHECGYTGIEEVPLGVTFFWPNASV